MASKRSKDFSATQYKLPMRWVRRLLAREGIGQAKKIGNLEHFHQMGYWFDHIRKTISEQNPTVAPSVLSTTAEWLTNMRFGSNAWPAFEDAMTGKTRRALRQLVSLAKRVEATPPKQFKPGELVGLMIPHNVAPNVYRAAGTVALMRGDKTRATTLFQRAVDQSLNDLATRKWFSQWLEQTGQIAAAKAVCARGVEIAESKQKPLETISREVFADRNSPIGKKSDAYLDVGDNSAFTHFFREKIAELQTK